MKKLLLASLALVASVSMASAADITETFVNTEENGFPTSWTKGSTTPVTITSASTGLKWTVLGCYVATNTYVTPNYDYLMINGKNTKGAYVSTSLTQACKEIDIVVGKGSSANAKSKVNVYGGETLIECVAAAQGETVKVSIPENLRAAGTVYKIESATTSYNQQITSITFCEPTAAASIKTDVEDVNLAMPLKASCTKTVKVIAENITGNITATCADANVTIVPATFTAAEGAEGVEITYTGTEADEIATKVTFAAGTITYELALNALILSNEGTETSPLNVNDVLTLNNLYTTEAVCVKGEIANGTAKNAVNGMVTLETEKPAKSNIVLVEGEKMIGVQLVSGSEAATTLNIVENPTNVGKTVVVKGTLEAYFSAPGVKNTEYISGLSGVENVGVDAAAQGVVKYYNLQGVEVANPENGLYIRVQGDKATKVIL